MLKVFIHLMPIGDDFGNGKESLVKFNLYEPLLWVPHVAHCAAKNLSHVSKISSDMDILCHMVVIRPPVYHYTRIYIDIHSGGPDEAMR